MTAPMYRIGGELRQVELVNGKLDIVGIEAALNYEAGSLRIYCRDRAGHDELMDFARNSSGLSFYSWTEMMGQYHFSEDNILMLSGKPNIFIIARFLVGTKVQFYMNYDRRILHSSVENLGWRAAKLVTYDSGDHDLELNEAVTLPLQNGRKYYLIRADEWFLELLKVIFGSLGTFTSINNIGNNTRRITMEEVVTIIVGVWAVMELVKGGAVLFYVSRWIWWGIKKEMAAVVEAMNNWSRYLI